MALSNIATNEINHSTMLQKGVLHILLQVYRETSDDECREFSAFAIANICGNPDYSGVVGAQGGIPPLIMLSQSNNINTLCLGLSALRRLANNEDNWPRLIQAGVLDSLASAGFSHEVEILREVSATICSLSLSEPHRVEVAYKCIMTIVHLSGSLDLEVARQAVGGMANLAEDINTHEYIAKAGGGRCLISLEAHDSLEIKREATRGISVII
jgi:hypothetical protein